MKYATYCAVVKVIHQNLRPGDRKQCMNILHHQFPDIDAQSLGSIYSQETLKKVKKTFHKHASRTEQYYARFENMSKDPALDPNQVIIFTIAREIDFPPSMLAKMIVERHLWWQKKTALSKAQIEATSNPDVPEEEKETTSSSSAVDTPRQNCPSAVDNIPASSSISSAASHSTASISKSMDRISTEAVVVTKQEVNKSLKNPECLQAENPKLASEVHLCNILDDDYGPLSDIIKQSIGHEKEVFLKRRAKELNLVFKDEDQMRAEGFDKTPDLRLEIPVVIEGVVIHWIESKASFGDESTHSVYLKDQFWSYQNRFGPGIVIYWFGFIAELDVNRSKGILLFDHLPENFIQFDPNKL